MDSRIDVSIIIPVYNTSNKLISRCLQSIIEQPYHEVEIIIIDDGSTEETAVYLDKLSRTDNRINVVHKENEGVSVARNLALDKAKGQFICFCDADDSIRPNFIAESVKIIKENSLDMVIGGICFLYLDKKQDHCIKTGKELLVYSKKEDIDALTYHMLMDRAPATHEELLNCMHGAVHERMIKKEFLASNRFRRGIKYYEDKIFNYELFKRATKIGVCPHIWYDYYANSGSALHHERLDIIANHELITQTVMTDFFHKSEEQYILKEFCYHLLAEAIKAMYSFKRDKIAAKSIHQLVENWISQDYWKTIFSQEKDTNARAKWRIFEFLILHRMPFTLCSLVKISYLINKLKNEKEQLCE